MVPGISIPYFCQESQELTDFESPMVVAAGSRANFELFRMPQVRNQDPEIGLEMLPSYQKAMTQRSEAVNGISIPYFGQESQELIIFESTRVVAGQIFRYSECHKSATKTQK